MAGHYVRYGDLSDEQKERADTLHPQWGENVLFWVEGGNVYKCAMGVKRQQHEENFKLCTFPVRPMPLTSGGAS